MCCCLTGFIVKYVLIIANIVFAIAGLVIVGLGVAVHVQIKEIVDLIPVDLDGLAVGIIVVGCAVFVISYLACCGAMKESRCMLVFYALFMAILAGVKIYFTVLIYNFLEDALDTVSKWIEDAFKNNSLSEAFQIMEDLFKCCGTTGAGSYSGASEIPASCCAIPIDSQCLAQDSYSGCINILGDYFETFGEAIGVVMIVVIIVEFVCVISGLFLSCQIRNKRYAAA